MGERNLDDHSRIDDGLRLAFGAAAESALDAIERLSGARSRLLLRDAPEDASPILRVAGPAERDGLTDDSRYQVLGEIARGGMGVVCKGRDRDLGRDVALKVLRADLAADGAVVQRFVEEAQVGGQLQHPGIVPIYSLGLEAGGRPYFAMKLIKGETLTALLAEGRKAAELIGVFERVAQTVAYAHSRGVIHRDLKPSNVMVGAFGEVHVVDWGFAKVLGRAERAPQPDVTVVATVRSGEDGSQSIAGSVMGTPAYMPPEQAMGQVDDLTERSDVFALGAILCEILTRKPPYTGTSQDQLLAAAHARLEEAHARLDACNAPDELKQLVRDCLQPLPKDRPSDAGVVAQRLADHLATVEERARQADLDTVRAAAAARRERRARRVTVALAAVILVALLGAGGGYHAWSEGERARAATAAAQVAPVMREATRQEGEGKWTEAKAAAANALALAETGGADNETLAAVREMNDRIEAQAAAADAREKKRAREAKLIDDLDELVMQSIDLSVAQMDAGYRAAFDDFGADVDNASAALKGFERKVELAVHLDGWARLRRQQSQDWKDLDRLARALDPDKWRNRLRDTALAKDVEALRELAASVDVGAQEPASLVWLADALAANDAPEDAVGLLRHARVRHPADFWIHYRLAAILWFTLHRAAEAMPYAKAAVALRPNSASSWNSVGVIREDGLGDPDGAIRALRRAVRLGPGVATFHCNLGNALADKRDIEGAIAEYKEAIRIDPRYARAHFNLGVALAGKGDLEGAIAEYEEAIGIDPHYARAHCNLGCTLTDKGDFDAAITEFEEAIRIDPRFAKAHCNFGVALTGKGDLEGAIAEYEAAIGVDPHYAVAHYNLGTALRKKGDLEGAVARYEEAVRIDPDFVMAHTNLGTALMDKGDVGAAIAEFEAAIRIDPSFAQAHFNLGVALQAKGDFEGSVEEFRRTSKLNPGDPVLQGRLARAERLFAAHARLPAVLRGEDRPSTAEEWLGLAELCYCTKDYETSARFWREAFAAGPAPDLRAGHRYNAACSAALAGGEWHAQALAWLRADLDAWRARLQAQPQVVAQALRHWKVDPDLASVRAASGAWPGLWADVDALLAQAEGASK